MKRTVLISLVSIFWTLRLPAAVPVPEGAAADSAALASAVMPQVPDSVAEVPNVAEPTPMSLEACMQYAVEHSPAVRRQDYTNRNYRQDYI